MVQMSKIDVWGYPTEKKLVKTDSCTIMRPNVAFFYTLYTDEAIDSIDLFHSCTNKICSTLHECNKTTVWRRLTSQRLLSQQSYGEIYRVDWEIPQLRERKMLSQQVLTSRNLLCPSNCLDLFEQKHDLQSHLVQLHLCAAPMCTLYLLPHIVVRFPIIFAWSQQKVLILCNNPLAKVPLCCWMSIFSNLKWSLQDMNYDLVNLTCFDSHTDDECYNLEQRFTEAKTLQSRFSFQNLTFLSQCGNVCLQLALLPLSWSCSFWNWCWCWSIPSGQHLASCECGGRAKYRWIHWWVEEVVAMQKPFLILYTQSCGPNYTQTANTAQNRPSQNRCHCSENFLCVSNLHIWDTPFWFSWSPKRINAKICFAHQKWNNETVMCQRCLLTTAAWKWVNFFCKTQWCWSHHSHEPQEWTREAVLLGWGNCRGWCSPSFCFGSQLKQSFPTF